MVRKLLACAAIFCCFAAVLGAETAFETGEKLFMQNKPREAKPALETALLRDSNNEKIYYYLGLIYEQLNDPAKSIDILRRGLLVATDLKDQFYFNIGINYFNQGDNILADKNYSLAIAENSVFASAYLNRANVRVRMIKYQDAIDDYKTYLRIDPNSPQREEIEKLIRLLQQSIDEQKDLLNSVLNSIKNASVDTQTESAGTEQFQKTNNTGLDIIE
jgi:tetratricopeptide (TPR) repeat protein